MGALDYLVFGIFGLIAVCSIVGLVMFAKTVWRYVEIRGKLKRGELNFDDVEEYHDDGEED